MNAALRPTSEHGYYKHSLKPHPLTLPSTTLLNMSQSQLQQINRQRSAHRPRVSTICCTNCPSLPQLPPHGRQINTRPLHPVNPHQTTSLLLTQLRWNSTLPLSTRLDSSPFPLFLAPYVSPAVSFLLATKNSSPRLSSV